MTHFNKEQIQKLYQYAMSLNKNSDNAYDLVQSTLERCLRHSAQPVNQMAYARTILRNLFIDTYRIQEKMPEDTYNDEIVSMHLDMQPLEQLMIDRDQLEKIWALLQPFETEVLYLWAVEGYTVQDVAKQLSIPKGTALARIHRLRKKLINLLEEPTIGDTA